jgi:uncharacterized membrane protein YphA (DoxX/SURF4 family)
VLGYLRILHTLVGVALGLILLYAGWVKVSDPRSFLLDLGQYDLFARPIARLLAVTLPWIEVVVGLALLTRRLTRGAAIVALLLGIGFVLAQGWALYHGIAVPCGCFGSRIEPIGPRSILTAASVMLASAWLVAASHLSRG